MVAATLIAPGPSGAASTDITVANPFPYCSWWVETSTQSTNVAEPDTNAAYWTTPFAVGDSPVSLNGVYIDARYFSVQVYRADGQPVEVLDSTGNPTTAFSTLADYSIVPDGDGSNPYETGLYAADAVTFSIDIVPYEQGQPVGATSLNTLPMPTSGSVGFVMIRTYVPNAEPLPSNVLGSDVQPAASVPQAFDLLATGLPTISVGSATATTQLPQCSSDDGARLTWSPPSGLASEAAPVLLEAITGPRYKNKQEQMDSTVYQDIASGAGSQLSFVRTKSATTPFPNGSSAYVAAPYELRPGQAVVAFANLPTTPWNATDTGTGTATGAAAQWPVGAVPVDWQDGAPSDYQLRYVSACNYVLAPPFPVTSVEFGCATDTQLHQVPANVRVAEGAIGAPRMVVITYPGDKFEPTAVTGAFTWLPARRTNADSIQAIALRNMLPSTNFVNSATLVDYTTEQLTTASLMAQETADVMGAFYPEGYICELATLRTLGPIECAKYASQRTACLSALADRNGQRGAVVQERAVRACLAALKQDVSSREFAHIRGCLIGNDTSCAHHDLSRADLTDALFSGADLRRSRMAAANLQGAVLERALLRHAHLPNATLESATAQLSDLTAANLASVQARNANFRQASLEVANLRGADLRGANLSGANLQGADLRGADLRRANLNSADLRGADLTGARLAGASTSSTRVNSPDQLPGASGVVVDTRPGPVAASRTDGVR